MRAPEAAKLPVDIAVVPSYGAALAAVGRVEKRNIVLSIGPLQPDAAAGGHEAVLRAFEEALLGSNGSDWHLVIAGDLRPEDDAGYVDGLRLRGRTIGIDVIVGPPRKTLQKLHASAMVCVFVAGAECVGRHSIAAVVTAISAGCVPVALSDGAAGDFCESEKIGFTFRKEAELVPVLAKAVRFSEEIGITSDQRVRMKAYSERSRDEAWTELIDRIKAPAVGKGDR